MDLLKKAAWIASALLCLLLVSISASAGWNEKGNGGDVVICADPSENKMYDAYEAESRHYLTPVYPQTSQDVYKIAKVIIERVGSQDLELREELLDILRNFPKEATFIRDSRLPNIEDLGLGFIPQDCELQQLIVQREPVFPTDARYTIALLFWNTLSPQQQAVGVVHEVLYRYALSMNPHIFSSESIRYFNAMLLSDSIRKLSSDDYRILKSRTFLWILDEIGR